MTHLICDLGFSSLKWMYKERRGRIVSAMQHEGGKLLIGDEALILAGSSYLKTIEELVHYYPVFVERAAQEAGIGTGEARLVVGLPYGVWHTEKDEPAGMVATLRKLLSASGWPDALILPQGLGGVRIYLAQCSHHKGNILGIDIGFNTVIFTLYAPDQKSIIHGDTFYKRGVHQMATRHLLPAIRKFAPSRSFTPVEISCLIEEGFIQYGFDRHDICREISQAARDYVEVILRDIRGELLAHAAGKSSFETVLLFGGGARLVKDHLSAGNVNLVIQDEPEFANASGFAVIAERAQQPE